jgi:carbonic anhydrase/acetyltransferase-like protein (isoleucine patch superfamily)
MQRSFDGQSPDVAESAHIDDTAVLIGDVTVKPGASVWPNATIRGDCGPIVIKERAIIQDNAVVHGESILESGAAVGHSGVLHNSSVAEEALVGINAVILDDARVGERSIVAAGSVVPEDTDIPPETLVAGSPATVKKSLKGDETIHRASHYQELARRHD